MKKDLTLKSCLIFLLLVPLWTSLASAAYASTHPTQLLAPFQKDNNNDTQYTATIGQIQYHITLSIQKRSEHREDKNGTLSFKDATQKQPITLKRAFNKNYIPNIMACNQADNTYVVLFKKEEEQENKQRIQLKMYWGNGDMTLNPSFLELCNEDIKDAEDVKICYLKYHNSSRGIIYYTYLKQEQRYFGTLLSGDIEGPSSHRQLSSSPNRFCVITPSEEKSRIENDPRKILPPVILTQTNEKGGLFAKAEELTPIAAKSGALPYAEDETSGKVIVFQSDQMLEVFPKQTNKSTFIAGYLGQHEKIYALFYQANAQAAPYTWYTYQATKHTVQEEQKHEEENNTTPTAIDTNIVSITSQSQNTFVITPDHQKIFCCDKQAPTQLSYTINTDAQPTSPWRHTFFPPLLDKNKKREKAWLYFYNKKAPKTLHIVPFTYTKQQPLKQEKAIALTLEDREQINEIIYVPEKESVYILLTKQGRNIVKQLEGNRLIETKKTSWITLVKKKDGQQYTHLVYHPSNVPKIAPIVKAPQGQYDTLGKSVIIEWGKNPQPSPIKFFWQSHDNISLFFYTEDQRVFKCYNRWRYCNSNNAYDVSDTSLLYWEEDSLYFAYNTDQELYHIPQAKSAGLYKKCDTYSALKSHTIVNIVKYNKQLYIVLKSKTHAKDNAPHQGYYIIPLQKNIPITDPEENAQSLVIAVAQATHNLIAKINNTHCLIPLHNMIKLLKKIYTYNQTEVWLSETDHGNTNIYLYTQQSEKGGSTIKQILFPKTHKIISAAGKKEELLLLAQDNNSKQQKVMYWPKIEKETDPFTTITDPFKTIAAIKDTVGNLITLQNTANVYTKGEEFELSVGWFTYLISHINPEGRVITCTPNNIAYRYLLYLRATIKHNKLTSIIIALGLLFVCGYLYLLYEIGQQEEQRTNSNHIPTNSTYRKGTLAKPRTPVATSKRLTTTMQAQAVQPVPKNLLFGLMMLFFLIGLAIGLGISMRGRKPLS